MNSEHKQFLEAEPVTERLLESLIFTMRASFLLMAESVGGYIFQEDGLNWIYTPSRQGRGVLPFTRLDPLRAGEQLDKLVDFYRHCQPFSEAMYWLTAPTEPSDLDVRLLARGFEWNWQPLWMWLDFQKMRTEHARPAGLRIAFIDEELKGKHKNLPYYEENKAEIEAARKCYPDQVWRCVAWLNKKVVGHCVLQLIPGELGAASIFNMGVVPSARNRGIGKALVLYACQFASSQGCNHAFLNATPLGEPMYRSTGFESLGYGYAWLLRAKTLVAPAPTSQQIAFVEAIGRGNIDELDALSRDWQGGEFNQPLTSGITPLEITVRLQKPASANWLVEHGVQLDVISAWDLGWKERVPELLATSPELVNKRYGELQTTPLHVAAERGDTELARLLLTANPRLDLEDTQFHSTAPGWASFFERAEILALLDEHEARLKTN